MIFYDCDADNDAGNSDGLVSSECGWRYLEAAPSDIVGGLSYVFGYYRASSSGANKVGTDTAIGTGKSNTEKLVKAMGSSTYSSSNGTSPTSNYAAKLCDDYSYGGYSDWFLPSRDELNLMYTNLKSAGLGGFADRSYWSSSEYGYVAGYAWEQDFTIGYQDYNSRGTNNRVRAVRAF